MNLAMGLVLLLAACTGTVGPQGEPGPQGPAGSQGEIGPEGLQGTVGPSGAMGPIGPEGSRGPAGSAGPRGAGGPPGATGETGPAGPPGGPIGPAGQIGPQGLQGEMGPAGPPGATGAIGPTGPRGPAGPAGPAGQQGPPGILTAPALHFPATLPVTLGGEGQQASAFFDLEAGLAIFRLSHDGRSNFTVWLLDSQGQRVELLVNEIGLFDGSTAIGIDEAGVYILDVDADGNWTVSIDQ